MRRSPTIAAVTARNIDDYIGGLDEPKRSTLAQLRATIREVLPQAEECISYSMPAFRLDGRVVAGFAAFKDHLSYLPHSGSVLSSLEEHLQGYTMTKGSLHFPVDRPLPKELVRRLVETRIAEVASRGR
jgi:uncharacterized protein YdhG (YjbR/CyaY superfamily)